MKLPRWGRQSGLLKLGYLADIIAVPDDPRTDIGALKDVVFVVKRSVIAKRPSSRKR